jgi:hypothetical protein
LRYGFNAWFRVIPALVAGIQREPSAGASRWLDAANKSRHDSDAPFVRDIAPKSTYGVLPPGFFRKVRDQLVALHAVRRVQAVPRTQ